MIVPAPDVRKLARLKGGSYPPLRNPDWQLSRIQILKCSSCSNHWGASRDDPWTGAGAVPARGFRNSALGRLWEPARPALRPAREELAARGDGWLTPSRSHEARAWGWAKGSKPWRAPRWSAGRRARPMRVRDRDPC